jgi:predicted MFS family arabinose efflux permease
MSYLKKSICLLLTIQLMGCAHQSPSNLNYGTSYNSAANKAAAGAAAATGAMLLGSLGAYTLLYLVGQSIAKGIANQASGRKG